MKKLHSSSGSKPGTNVGIAWIVASLVIAFGAGLISCERPPLCPDATFATEIPVPAVILNLSPMFAPINATASSGPPGVSVDIASNQGTVAFAGRGPFQAFIYERIPFTAGDTTLYAGLGIEDGAWFPFWLYCSNGRLTAVDGEMTDVDLGLAYDVDGSCSDENVPPMAPVSIPAHTLHPVALTCGFTVSATGQNQLDLSGGKPGTMSFQGDSAVVLPFHTVDCRTDCGPTSWFELHAIIWDPTKASVGFGIVYLDTAGATADNGILLPTGDVLVGDDFPNAIWTLSR